MSTKESGRVGIMGGTFDPIHYGHLVAAETAREAFRLDKVIFVPAGIPPHKVQKHLTAARHRYLMTLLAIMGNPGFEASRVDLDRGRVTYTVDTLRDLRKTLPDASLYFITGADAILEILSWKAPKEVLSLAEFIAVSRPGYGLEQLTEALGSLYELAKNRIHLLDMPPMGISSTDLRRRLATKCSARYLLPEAVLTYIQREGLYASNTQ